MSVVSSFPLAKLITGILISKPIFEKNLLHKLVSLFGPIDYKSKSIIFNFTNYYDKEMGKPIYRMFISFQRLIDPEKLSNIKISTNQLEGDFIIDSKRKVNIDPGIMFLSRFILATTKNGPQRIPLKNGIYGEITLLFKKKTFRSVEWTYPDFRNKEYIDILNHIRQIYKNQIDLY